MNISGYACRESDLLHLPGLSGLSLKSQCKTPCYVSLFIQNTGIHDNISVYIHIQNKQGSYSYFLKPIRLRANPCKLASERGRV